jgi:beta-mannanase
MILIEGYEVRRKFMEKKMTNKYYAQGNKQGYVVSITTESLLVGLFGGSYKEIDKETADQIRKMKDNGLPVRLDEINEIKNRRN